MPMFPYSFPLKLACIRSKMKRFDDVIKKVESVDHFKFHLVEEMIADGESLFTTLPVAVISRFLIIIKTY